MTDNEKRAHDLALIYLNQKLNDSNSIMNEKRIPSLVTEYTSAYEKILEILK